MVSTDNTVKLAPGVTSVVKLVEGPVQEMVGTGLPCALQLNVAWRDWFTVRSIGGPRKKVWAGWMGGGEEVADSEWEIYIHYICVCVCVCVWRIWKGDGIWMSQKTVRCTSV